MVGVSEEVLRSFQTRVGSKVKIDSVVYTHLIGERHLYTMLNVPHRLTFTKLQEILCSFTVNKES